MEFGGRITCWGNDTDGNWLREGLSWRMLGVVI